jgi:hypothetical protein
LVGRRTADNNAGANLARFGFSLRNEEDSYDRGMQSLEDCKVLALTLPATALALVDEMIEWRECGPRRPFSSRLPNADRFLLCARNTVVGDKPGAIWAPFEIVGKGAAR